MQIDNTSALVDANFINGLGESNLSCEILIERLKTIFREIFLKAIVHPLIYDNELLNKGEKMTRLFSENVIFRTSFDEIFSGEQPKIDYYSMVIEELYYKINGEKINTYNKGILNFWCSEKNLGEIHSLATCLICDCVVFLSDDGDSSELSNYIKDKYKKYINIYNRLELIDKHLREGSTKITRSERRSITHGLN